MGLGDAIHSALSAVGITPERVERWLGRPCGCHERQEKLNQIGYLVKRILSGKTENAEKYLDGIINPEAASSSDASPHA